MTYVPKMNAQELNFTEVKKVSTFKLSENILNFIALMCFSISLFLPVFFTSAEDIYGFWVLVTGWMGLAFFQVAWYANPLNLLVLLLVNEHPRIAFLLSLLALLVASCSFLFYEIPTGINYEKVFIQELGLGFYFWYIAHILILSSTLLSFIGSLKKI